MLLREREREKNRREGKRWWRERGRVEEGKGREGGREGVLLMKSPVSPPLLSPCPLLFCRQKNTEDLSVVLREGGGEGGGEGEGEERGVGEGSDIYSCKLVSTCG